MQHQLCQAGAKLKIDSISVQLSPNIVVVFLLLTMGEYCCVMMSVLIDKITLVISGQPV